MDINKRQIPTSIAPKTRQEHKDYKYNLYPLTSVSIAQNLRLQNNNWTNQSEFWLWTLYSTNSHISMMKRKLMRISSISRKTTSMNCTKRFRNSTHTVLELLKIIFGKKTGLPKEQYQISAKTLTIKQEVHGRRPSAIDGEKNQTKKDLESQMKDVRTGILTLDLENFSTEIP